MGKTTDKYIKLPDLIFIVLFISSQPILAVDLPSSVFTEWYSEGVKKSEFNFVEDKKEGAWREWYNDEFSTLKSTSYFQADKAEDIFTRWYKNGNKKEEG